MTLLQFEKPGVRVSEEEKKYLTLIAKRARFQDVNELLAYRKEMLREFRECLLRKKTLLSLETKIALPTHLGHLAIRHDWPLRFSLGDIFQELLDNPDRYPDIQTDSIVSGFILTSRILMSQDPPCIWAWTRQIVDNGIRHTIVRKIGYNNLSEFKDAFPSTPPASAS